MQRFFCQTEIVYGAGALDALQEETVHSVLIVSDPFFAKNGEAARIGALIPGASVTIFGEVTPDPTLELVTQGLALLQQCRPELLIALGGGSAIDTAKGIAHGAANPDAMICLTENRPRFCAIPTTSGTGSEVTSFSILTHNGTKYPLIDRQMVPDLAILDSDLLTALPASLVADAGMDILSHCLEAIAATGATPFSDALASHSFSLVLQKLPASFRGDTQVRGEIHLAATMAGMAFEQAGLGVCHALSHALGGAFHLPHGRLNAILLPAVVQFNAQSVADRYAKLARQCGIGGSGDAIAVRNLVSALRRLRKTLRLPDTLKQAGIQDLQQKMPQILHSAMQDACLHQSPPGLRSRPTGDFTGGHAAWMRPFCPSESTSAPAPPSLSSPV